MAYKSKYYDPVKAHEYYMKHRKLKGRVRAVTKMKAGKAKKATGSKKKSSAKKVNRTSTKDFNTEGLVQATKAKDKINTEKKEFTKKLNAELKEKLKQLKAGLEGKTDDEKADAIARLKVQYDDIKKKVNSYYKEKYARELDTIRADAKYRR